MLSDKVHATELSHFIKLFPYPIQNRDKKTAYRRKFELQ